MAASVLELALPPLPKLSDVHAVWLTASARSDVATMRELLKRFPEWLDLHWGGFCLSTLGASALHTATWKVDSVVMEFLLELGQHPDPRDDNGLTPMMVTILRLSIMTTRCVFRGGQAVRRNLIVDCREEENKQQKKVIMAMKLLLRFDANVNAQSQDGKTALHCATSDGSYEIAKLLLDTGVNADTQDKNGKTPLHYCIEEAELVVTDLILSHGASIDVPDTDGITPIRLMLRRADLNILQLFLNHHQWVATSQRQDFAGWVLLQAVDVQAESIVRFVVDNGYAPLMVCNEKGETAMHRAILPAVMELISDLGPNGDTLIATTTQGATSAHYASAYGSAREVETLLLCLTRVFGDLEEFEQLGGTNPLNVPNGSDVTSLYIASTTLSSTESGFECSNTISLQDRNEKVRLLLDHGGRLFPDGFLAQSMNLDSYRLMLPAQVRRFLKIWLTEEGSCNEDLNEVVSDLIGGDIPALKDLCTQWIACVTCLGPSRTVVVVVTGAGYAHETLLLLLDLPFRRREFSTFLAGLQRFAAHRRTDILFQRRTCKSLARCDGAIVGRMCYDLSILNTRDMVS
ncbi:hypothetical protein L917_10474, partial [Phytophthora nicotianae]